MNTSFLKRIALVGLLGFFSTTLTGCPMLSRMLKKNRYKKRRAAKKQQSKAALAAFFANKDCKKVNALYKALPRRMSRSMKVKKYNHYGYELGRCGQWKYFFENVVNYGRVSSSSVSGMKMMEHMESKGLPVLAKFKAWHGSGAAWAGHPGKYGRHYNTLKAFASKHVTNWLLSKSNPKQFCSLFKSSYSRYHDWVKTNALNFMSKASCPSAVKFHRLALLSRNVGHKQIACRFLGDKGTRADVSRLYTLARTDSSWVRVGRRRTWTSTVCRAAAGRIKLRLN